QTAPGASADSAYAAQRSNLPDPSKGFPQPESCHSSSSRKAGDRNIHCPQGVERLFWSPPDKSDPPLKTPFAETTKGIKAQSPNQTKPQEKEIPSPPPSLFL